ncbi:DUF5710 domain-containing protein [Simiduia aestuariiviva]|uniref:DUF5710 domain-containing protein n=1 Tax=Simiduia aestuariiviva TaxID=1510459 RepID=A0A839UL88_9GAMM|nr:DUF5710 domain-containing protein [Simiduia aestuariiviva]MBB3168602.1 hypothetical protein [Simiduia aestuariiviva]
MKVIKTIAPNKPGARKFLKLYGDNLIAVRYRKAAGRRLITIEILVDEYSAPQDSGGPRVNHQENREPVGFHLNFDQHQLRAQAKALGARWSQHQKLWYLPRHQVVALGLVNNIVAGAAERCVDVDLLLNDAGEPSYE